MILNKIEKEFIESHSDLIEKEDWEALYAQLRSSPVAINLYDILKDAGIDLLKDYHLCPNGYAARCESLPSDLDIPEGVESIGNVAFFQTTIERVHLPTTIKNIGDGAFSHCDDLIEINIPAAIETIGMNSFRNCNSLKEVKFAKTSSLFCIQEGTFQHSGIETIALPEGVEVLREGCFEECYYLTTISLPQSLTKISYNALPLSQFLKTINYAGTREQFKKMDLEEGWIPYQENEITIECSDGNLRLLAGEVVD